MVASNMPHTGHGVRSRDNLATNSLKSGLGSRLLISKVGRRRKMLTLLEGIGSFFFAAFLFVLAFVTPDNWLFISGIGVFVVFYGATRLVVYRREKSLVIGLYQNGLIYRSYKGGTAVLWDDIQSVTAGVLANMAAHETHYTILIQTRSGREISIRTSNRILTEIGIINNAIQRQVTNRLLPRSMEAFKTGRTLAFGSLLVNRAGIRSGDKRIPWAEVEVVELKNGVVHIRQRNQGRNWSSMVAGSLPNALVFLGIVDQVLHAGEFYGVRNSKRG